MLPQSNKCLKQRHRGQLCCLTIKETLHHKTYSETKNKKLFKYSTRMRGNYFTTTLSSCTRLWMDKLYSAVEFPFTFQLNIYWHRVKEGISLLKRTLTFLFQISQHEPPLCHSLLSVSSQYISSTVLYFPNSLNFDSHWSSYGGTCGGVAYTVAEGVKWGIYVESLTLN